MNAKDHSLGFQPSTIRPVIEPNRRSRTEQPIFGRITHESISDRLLNEPTTNQYTAP